MSKIESRLSWKELTKETELTAETIIAPEIPEIKVNRQGNKTQVCQLLNNEVIAIYPSIAEASKATNIDAISISKVVRRLRKSTGGYEWKYL